MNSPTPEVINDTVSRITRSQRCDLSRFGKQFAASPVQVAQASHAPLLFELICHVRYEQSSPLLDIFSGPTSGGEDATACLRPMVSGKDVGMPPSRGSLWAYARTRSPA
jgi:hypothetical protein